MSLSFFRLYQSTQRDQADCAVVKRRYCEPYHTRRAHRGNRGVNVCARYGHGGRGAEGPEAALSPRKSQCSRRAWVGHVSDGAASQRPGTLLLQSTTLLEHRYLFQSTSQKQVLSQKEVVSQKRGLAQKGTIARTLNLVGVKSHGRRRVGAPGAAQAVPRVPRRRLADDDRRRAAASRI